MKAVIPENLVTMYDLTVPPVLGVRKLRRQLDAELEKLHPCFPSQCAVDYQLNFRRYGQRNPGLHIRAVVIDRLVLTAIRKKNAGRFLYTAGSHPYRVFSRELLHKRLGLAVAVLCVAATAVCTVCLARPEAAETEIAVASAFMNGGTEASDSAAAGVSALESSSAELAALPDYSPFICSIYAQGGSLSSFLWEADTGVFSFTATGLYPEQYEAASDYGVLRFGPVTYSDGKPVLEVALAAVPDEQTQPRMAGAAGQPVVSANGNAAQQIPAIRRLFSESGGSLLSETVTPPSLSGSVPEAAWATFASGLTEEAAGGISRLSLARGNGTIRVSLELAESVAFFPFTCLEYVFSDAPDLPFAPAAPDEWAAAVSESRDIGRIERADGSAVVFFHNSEGKIERRMYEN